MPTTRELAIPIPHEEIAAFCRKWGIKRLSFFGSIVRDDFDPERSDVDVLVELRPDTKARGLEYFGAEIELSEIYRHLGVQLSTGPAVAKGNHSYGGRIVASIFTGGLYFLWWLADIMREGNNHFQANWVWEDELANAVVTTAAA